jgi:ABC-type dipeptide/oligopeptide/nickel transport system permease subunit
MGDAPADSTNTKRRRRIDVPSLVGAIVLGVIFLACLGSLPWTTAPVGEGAGAVPRYNAGDPRDARLAPDWFGGAGDGTEAEAAEDRRSLLGTDHLGRSVFVRALTGGGISLGIGLAAALIAVCIGTLYGAVAGYSGGAVDSVMMRVVDVLYGLPYILLVVLLAVASDAVIDEFVTRAQERADWVYRETIAEAELLGQPVEALDRAGADAWRAAHPVEAREIESAALEAVPPRRVSQTTRSALDVVTLFLAIGGVSWLTMARVVRGQVLSLKQQPFVEAARAIGAKPGADLSAAPAAEPARADHRVRDADGAAGDPAGELPELPRDRRQAAAAELGQPGGGGAR